MVIYLASFFQTVRIVGLVCCSEIFRKPFPTFSNPNLSLRLACLVYLLPPPRWLWDSKFDRRNSNAKPLAQDVLALLLIAFVQRANFFWWGIPKWDFQSGGKIQTHSTSLSNSNIFKTWARYTCSRTLRGLRSLVFVVSRAGCVN